MRIGYAMMKNPLHFNDKMIVQLITNAYKLRLMKIARYAIMLAYSPASTNFGVLPPHVYVENGYEYSSKTLNFVSAWYCQSAYKIAPTQPEVHAMLNTDHITLLITHFPFLKISLSLALWYHYCHLPAGMWTVGTYSSPECD
jgi:hypothetical protein